jgi:hypothetical protein
MASSHQGCWKIALAHRVSVTTAGSRAAHRLQRRIDPLDRDAPGGVRLDVRARR